MNWYSSVLWFMLPVVVFAIIAVLLAIYFKWKRGLELFMLLCVVLFVSPCMHAPFLLGFVHRANPVPGRKCAQIIKRLHPGALV
jgi:hypothetical protein